MSLNTAIRGEQIRANEIDESHLKTSVAGNGLTGGNGSALALDLNELSAVVVDVSADYIAIIDATDNSSKKEAIADVITAIAGVGLSATNGVLAIDLNELTGAVIDVTADSIVFIDATDDGSKKESVDDLVTALAGDGIQNIDSQLAIDVSDFAGYGLKDDGSENLDIDFSEITEVAVDVSADYIMIQDVTDNSSKKESIADLATAMAGSGLTATNGVLSVDAITDNVVEADFAKEDESANCDGIETDFTLTSTPVTNSVQVFLNGSLQQEGSGKDYTLSGTTVSFVVAPETDDRLIIYYVIND
jgi:hypothetical protein